MQISLYWILVCIRIFKPKFETGVIDLYSALKNNDSDLAASAYEAAGVLKIQRKSYRYIKYMGSICMYEPLLQDKDKPIAVKCQRGHMVESMQAQKVSGPRIKK